MHSIPPVILQKALCGAPVTRADAASLTDLLPGALCDLMAAARLSASEGHAGPFTCGIINAKSGRCPEDCAFCAQSAHYATPASAHPLADVETLLARAVDLAGLGASYMGMVISGAAPSKGECEALCEAARVIRSRVDIRLCASLGLLTPDLAAMLREAGFTSYHHNLETSAGFYASICTTHSHEQRVQSVLTARKAGLRVCSGGVFGLGETWADRLDLAAHLQALDVDSIPVNFLTPIPGTPLEHRPLLPRAEALAVVALFRLMHPGRDIIICGGRAGTLGDWDSLVFAAGANAVMTGDYLTTKGGPPDRDRVLMRDLGLIL